MERIIKMIIFGQNYYCLFIEFIRAPSTVPKEKKKKKNTHNFILTKINQSNQDTESTWESN